MATIYQAFLFWFGITMGHIILVVLLLWAIIARANRVYDLSDQKRQRKRGNRTNKLSPLRRVNAALSEA
ncbi:MAG: hypothetical protein QM680_10670 [Luteolibacter sp.]